MRPLPLLCWPFMVLVFLASHPAATKFLNFFLYKPPVLPYPFTSLSLPSCFPPSLSPSLSPSLHSFLPSPVPPSYRRLPPPRSCSFLGSEKEVLSHSPADPSAGAGFYPSLPGCSPFLSHSLLITVHLCNFSFLLESHLRCYQVQGISLANPSVTSLALQL